MKVDGLDINVRVEGVLVEENRATFVMGHVEAIREKLVVKIFGRLLQGNDMPPSCNLLFQGIFFLDTMSKRASAVSQWKGKINSGAVRQRDIDLLFSDGVQGSSCRC